MSELRDELRWRLTRVASWLTRLIERVADRLYGIESRCEGCRRVLDDVARTYVDDEGVELCVACYAASIVRYDIEHGLPTSTIDEHAVHEWCELHDRPSSVCGCRRPWARST